MLFKMLIILITSSVISLIFTVFKGLTLSHFISNLFMISILVLCYGFFKLMDERKVFRSFKYSKYAVRSFFNSFLGNKSAYVERVEREALGIEEEPESKYRLKFEEFMLKDVKKDEYTLPMFLSGVLMMLVSIAIGFAVF